MSYQAPPSATASVQGLSGAMPTAPRGCPARLGTLIIDTADRPPGLDAPTESLKWSGPGFLIHATRSSATIRLGWKPSGADTAAIFAHCSTRLVNERRDPCSGTLAYLGSRAIDPDITTHIPDASRSNCIATALTSHARKHAR